MVKAISFPVAKFKPEKFDVPVFESFFNGKSSKKAKKRFKSPSSSRKRKCVKQSKSFVSGRAKFKGKKALVFAGRSVAFASRKFKARQERKREERFNREAQQEAREEREFKQTKALSGSEPIDRSKSTVTEFDEEGNEIKRGQ